MVLEEHFPSAFLTFKGTSLVRIENDDKKEKSTRG